MQTSRQFEILVSDDCSAEDRTEAVRSALDATGRPYQLHRQEHNLGYDGNVRFCLRVARGRHVLLLGHDDALASPDEAAEVIKALDKFGNPDVAFTNYEDWATGEQTVRAATTAVIGSGVDAALSQFRAFSFVGGLVFKPASVLAHDTDRWDQSIYVQVFLACRTLASGGCLLGIARSAVRKDIRIEAQTVETYATRIASGPRSFAPRPTGLEMVIRVTLAAIGPFAPEATRRHLACRVTGEVMVFSYLFWLLEYRRVGGLPASVGVARTMAPGRVLAGESQPFLDRIVLTGLYAAVTAVGLLAPTRLALRLAHRAAALVRRRRQRDA